MIIGAVCIRDVKIEFFWIIDYRNENTDFYSIIVFLIALYRRTADSHLNAASFDPV